MNKDRPIVPLNVGPPRLNMDQQLIDALTALTGQMNLNQQAQTQAQQQLHADLLAQQQAQQDMINQLAAIQGKATASYSTKSCSSATGPPLVSRQHDFAILRPSSG